MRPEVEPHVMNLIRDIYRLSAFDTWAAVELFTLLCRDGYRVEVHRRTLAALEGHQRKGRV
ncbi:MAG: hypothetical protein EBT79_07595 [Actinobacteria bacterium]|nr:hypothetical protein [Actinomycetota bacterium]NBR67123.1 hypothetical protein [Actinomycetota bacterium]